MRALLGALCVYALVQSGYAMPDRSRSNGCPSVDNIYRTVHLPHPDDCTKFLRCDHGIAKEELCPSGLHFNPVLQVCDWPNAAGCKAGITTEKPTTTPVLTLPTECPFPDPIDHTVNLPHATNCTLYYRCENGQPKLKYCPDNLHFNPVLTVCDWPDVAGCIAEIPTEEPTTTPVPTLPKECPFPDPMDHTVHLPHATNCTLFYRCDHGQPKLEYCPDNLHFNPVLQVCDWPGNAGCEAESVTSPPTEAPATTPRPTTPKPTTPKPTTTAAPTTKPTNAPPTAATTEAPDNTLPNGCPFPDPMDHTVHLPHPTNCSLFYRCDHGKPKLDYCPDNLHFNPVLQVCDWPEYAGCEAEGITSPPTEAPATTPRPTTPKPTTPKPTTPVATTPKPTNAPSTEGTTEAPDNTLPNGCPFPDPMDHTVHLPHPTNCSLFYRCDHGKPKLDYCPDNLHFNPVLQVCDWPENAGCEAGGIASPPTESPATTAKPTNAPTTPAATTPKPTNAPPTAATTEAPDNTLPNGCPFPDPMDHTVHLPHPTNCSLFYRCDHGKPKLDYCPDNLHFNPVLQVCDWPENAGCESEGITSPPTGAPVTTPKPTTAKPTTPAATTPKPTNAPSTEGTTEAPDNTLPNGCPFPDPMDHTVHLPHPTNCSLFYRCDHGKPKLDYCPDNLHFNPVLQVCDWPAYAGCEAEGIASPPTEAPATTPRPTTPKPTTPKPTTPVATTPKPTNAPSTEGTTEAPDNTLPDGCPFPDPMDHTVHLPHPTNCSLFYRCDNGKPKLDYCPDTLHFNPVLQVCDWPENAGCEAGGITSPPTEAPATTAKPSTPAATTPKPTNAPPTAATTEAPDNTLPNGCPFPDPMDHTVHLPHPTNCSLFYRCDHGKPKLDYCPDNLHFNPVLQVCDWPEYAGCESEGITSPPTGAPATTPRPTTPKPTTPKPTTPAATTPKPTNAPPTAATTEAPDNTLPNGCPFPDPMDHTVHLPHPTNCSLFYRCDHGKPKLDYCPDNLHFNPVLQVCDWPEYAGCEAEGITSPPTEAPATTPRPTTPKPTTPKPTTPVATTPKPTNAPSTEGTTEAPDNTLPNGCPFPDPMDHTVHLPHPTNCSLFYRCDHGKPKLDYCPDNLHFNPVLQVCDWPAYAGCEAEGIASPPTEAPATTPRPTTPKPTTPKPTTPVATTPKPTNAPSTEGTTEAPDNTLPNGCPFPDPMDHTVHLPHPTNCSLFYRCDHGKPKLDYCPDNLHFNPVLQVCDWPENAGCEAWGITSPPTEAPATTAKPSTPAATTPKPTNAPPTAATTEAPDNTLPNGCPFPDPMDHTVHLPHPTNCSLFYRCDHGKPKLDYCPDNLHFNPVLQVCDWPEYAGCESEGITSPPTGAPATTPRPTTPKPTTPKPTTPAATTPKPTNAPPTAATTEAPDNTLPNGCPFPDPMDHTVHLPHPTNCSLFYRCDHGKPKLDYCPDNLHFNPVLQVCDWPENAGCESEGITSPPTGAPVTTPKPTTAKPTTPAATTPKPTNAPSTEGTTEAPDNTLPNGCPFPDPMDHTVHLPHPTNCSLFYRCDHGKPKLDYCPDNLHFNPVLQVCDWPENAGCEAGGITSPPTEAPATTAKPTNAPTTAATTEAPDNTLPNGCPFPDPMDHTVHLPHPTNCSLFYRCDHGKPKLDYCPDNLHFNPVLQVCDWPGNAGCEAEGITSPPTEAPATTPAPDGCDGFIDDTVQLPHPGNCSLYLMCNNNEIVTLECPEGQYFDSVLLKCDWACHAVCLVEAE